MVQTAGAHGSKRTPKSFDLSKIREKSLQMGKITENQDKNGAQRCLASGNGTQYLQKITRRPFSEGHTKGIPPGTLISLQGFAEDLL